MPADKPAAKPHRTKAPSKPPARKAAPAKRPVKRSLRWHMVHAFKPLPLQAKAAIAVLFAWMLLLTLGLTIALVKVTNEANSHYREQQTTAAQAKLACERSRVFGPPFLDHIAKVEARLHLGALETKVMFHGKQVDVLQYYRSTIPKDCHSAKAASGQ